MSRAIVTNLQGAFNRSFGMLEQFIEVCPWDAWVKQFGGWPVWQQVYHAASSIDLFVLEEGGQPSPPLFEPEIGGLKKVPDEELTAPPKAVMQEFAAAMKAKANAYIDGLSDADLAQKNPGLSARVKTDMTHAVTLAMMAGHAFYHLGACDAALRDQGLKGVF